MADGRVLLGRPGRAGASIPVRSISDHEVQFMWHSHRVGQGMLHPSEVAELFAQGFVGRERQVRVQSVSDSHSPGCQVRLGSDGPVELAILLDEGSASAPEVLSIGGVPWRRIGGRLASTPGAEAPVVLGLLAWMYDHEPAAVRRLLENRLASQGSRIVSIALRLFELGWHLGPGWAPFRCRWLPSDMEGRAPEEETVEEDLRYRKLTTTGGRALAHGALVAGLNRCSHSPFHPLVEQFVYEFRRGGGTLERNAHEHIVARPARPTDLHPEDGPRLVVHVPGHSLPRERTGRQVTLCLDRIPRPHQSSAASTGARPNRLSPFRTPPSVVLIPSSIDECYKFVRLAGRISREWDQDVTILIDGALLSAKGSLRIDRAPSLGKPSAVAGLSAAVSPMNCRVFAPSVFSPGGRKGTKGAPDAGAKIGPVPVAGVEKVLPQHHLFGDEQGEVLLVSWGAGREEVEAALERWRQRGRSVSGLHVTALPPAGDGLFAFFSGFSRVVLLERDGGVAGSHPGRRTTMERLLQERRPGAGRRVLPGEWPEERPAFSLETWTLSREPGTRGPGLIDGLGRALQAHA